TTMNIDGYAQNGPLKRSRMAVSVWLVATVVGIWASRRIAFLLKLFGERTSIAVMAFGLALILSGLFEEAGLAMIIGAYVMGLSLSQSDIVHVIRERLHTIYALMVPVFFCVTGMFINVRAMADTQVLLFAAIYTVFAFGAKFLGCGLPALMAQFNLLGASRIGLGMVPRGEVGLIIATLGLAAGVLNDNLFAAIIIMVVVNTVVAPLGLVKLFERSAPGVVSSAAVKSDTTALHFNFSSYSLVDLFVAKLTEVFEADGFFTHVLSPRDRLYQARKEHRVIEYQRKETTFTVVFNEAHTRLVHTAILDAVASVELAVKELRSPLRDAELQETLVSKTTDVGRVSTHEIVQVLKPHMIKTDLHGHSKSEVIHELLTFLCDTGQLPRRHFNAVLDEIMTREACMSTGFSGGLAIPHARVNCIDDLVCVVGVYPHGIAFDAFDGNPSHVFALVLSPESRPTPHLEFIAEVAGAFQRFGSEAFLKARNTDAIYEMLVDKKQ
ncbi:MAG: PTS sugar transporter subunit IIA, partial [Deltaproteobacteria bacterium]|nr:PTS sugar transporter subunit IIA [Deltaproteobacteria bacterium]